MNDRTSPSIQADARRAESQMLAAMARLGQRHVAEAMGISESVLSEMKNSEKLAKLASWIVACGFKLVPVSEQTFDAPVIGALKTLAGIGLAHLNAQAAEIDA